MPFIPFGGLVSDLPPYRMGPYHLKIVSASQDKFSDKRRKMEADWNAGIVHLRHNTDESRALVLLTHHLITAIHYRSGTFLWAFSRSWKN